MQVREVLEILFEAAPRAANIAHMGAEATGSHGDAPAAGDSERFMAGSLDGASPTSPPIL